MALVNNKYNFIFFHLYKCGGMSMREMLLDLHGNNEIYEAHILPCDFKKNKPKLFERCFKFTVIRNPFDFIRSTYEYVRLYKNHFMYEEANKLTFSQFIDYYMKCLKSDKKEKSGGQSNRVTTIYDFLYDENENRLIDAVYRLENIQEDFDILCKHLSLPIKGRKFAMKNVTVNGTKDYRLLYNDESREKVERFFKKELEIFKYKF